MADKEDCINAIEKASDILGESPTKAQYEELGLTPAASTILRHTDGWNAAKEQAGLETNPSTGSRVEQKPPDVSLPEDEEWAEMSQDQRWHYKHPVENTQRSLNRRQKLRQWLHSIKVESAGCVECGETDPACLDFHHRDEEPKEMAVNKMVPYGYSKSDIRSEVEKCEILCANCHWTKHHSTPAGSEYVEVILQSSGPTQSAITKADFPAPCETSLTKEECLRAWTYAYQKHHGCMHCGEQNPIRLQFHHSSEKSMGVGAMISDSKPVEMVFSEVKRCTVLCANCHRREHYDYSYTE